VTGGWAIVTGEYPPRRGGVADYSALVARRLAGGGAPVRVWTPAAASVSDDNGLVRLRRLPHGFGLRSLVTREPARAGDGPPHRWLVQYVPQAFGYRGMNLAFCAWLARRREPVWTMFHEVVFPREPGQPARHRLLASVTRAMAAVVARASERVFVSTPAWARILRSIAPRAAAAEWLPVPSTIPRAGDPDAARVIRRRYGGPLVGYFGGPGPLIAEQLAGAIPALLERVPDASVVLLGEGGVGMRRRLADACPALARRLWATGPLAARDVSTHLLACDLMLQPFVEGVTTRRTSVMAALVHGVATVTTAGALTEPLWRETRAVALAPARDPAALATLAASLLGEGEARARLGAAGRAAYDAHFDVRHTIAALDGSVRGAARAADAVVA
jgi:glycosyltransferase involved in cell wall biosynthesis